MIFPVLCPMLLAVTSLATDPTAHSVRFTARATDVVPGTTVEFAFVGPDSDRAYEAAFVTDTSVSDLAKAFAEAGIPCGKPVCPAACRFWPVGCTVSVSPSPWDYITDRDNATHLPIVFTGGLRDAAGRPVADTNMPMSVFSLYSQDQSLLLTDDAIDQSAVYGRFTSNGKAKPGERVTFTVSWDGATRTSSQTVELKPGAVRQTLAGLKECKPNSEIMPVFSPELTVIEARSAASALAVIDSRTLKVNGFAEGQFFYRGFLPDERWRDRQKRLTQPLEVHLDPTNVVCTVIHEDWSVEGLDPRLTPEDVPLANIPTAFVGDSCLFYAASDMPLSRIYVLMRNLPRTIRNWYVFID